MLLYDIIGALLATCSFVILLLAVKVLGHFPLFPLTIAMGLGAVVEWVFVLRYFGLHFPLPGPVIMMGFWALITTGLVLTYLAIAKYIKKNGTK